MLLIQFLIFMDRIGHRMSSLIFADDVVLFSTLGYVHQVGRAEWEIDRCIRPLSAVIQILYRSVVVKTELSIKTKLLIYWSIYVPAFTYGYDLWVMTERMRSKIQYNTVEISFPEGRLGSALEQLG